MIIQKRGTPLLIVMILLSFASIAAATPFDVNLIVNPGGETPAGGSWGSNVRPSDWTVVSNFEVVRYAVGGTGDLNAADSAAIGGGLNYFAGGYDNSSSSAFQIIDISDLAAQVDAGLVSGDFNGYLGGWDGHNDNMVVDAIFLDSSSNEISGPIVELGPVTSGDRGAESTLLFRFVDGGFVVPNASRAIKVTMTATLTSGGYNDGYADNLFLALHSEPEHEPIPEPTTILLLGSGLMGLVGFRGRIRRR